MHEWALAEAVVEAVRREAAGRRVVRASVRFGELQQVDRAIFETALGELAGEGGMPVSAFTVQTEPAQFACRACGHAWTLADSPELDGSEREAVHFLPEAAHVYLACPACGSSDYEIVAGRGVSIAEIELEGAP